MIKLMQVKKSFYWRKECHYKNWWKCEKLVPFIMIYTAYRSTKLKQRTYAEKWRCYCENQDWTHKILSCCLILVWGYKERQSLVHRDFYCFTIMYCFHEFFGKIHNTQKCINFSWQVLVGEWPATATNNISLQIEKYGIKFGLSKALEQISKASCIG